MYKRQLYNFDELKPEEILNRDIRAEKNVEDVVDAIIADVRARGDDALKDYTLKFDGATIENLQVTQAEIDEAFALSLIHISPFGQRHVQHYLAGVLMLHRRHRVQPVQLVQIHRKADSLSLIHI